jgi:hypothetical protein
MGRGTISEPIGPKWLLIDRRRLAMPFVERTARSVEWCNKRQEADLRVQAGLAV